MKINYDRMIKQFIEMTKIDAPSNKELPMQKYMEKELKKLGGKVYVDDAGSKYETTAEGNVMAHFAGTVKSKPFILGAHLDTVEPCKNVKAIIKNGKIVTDGTTVLGADDRAGLAIILEVIRTLKESKEAYPPIEVACTLCEEDGMYGAKYFDASFLKGKEGLILDDEFPTELIINAPKAYVFEIKITGKAAHAGVCPEKGISALEVAAKAISMMKLGRIDKLTVANLGIVHGGTGTNIVMPEIYLKGEARSRNLPSLEKQVKHMRECFKKVEKMFTKKVDGKIIKPIIDFKQELKYPLLDIPKNLPLIKYILKCAKENKIKMETKSCGGGFDSNILASKGLLMPIIGIGYHDNHTVKEWLNIKEYCKTADLVLHIVKNYRK